MKSRAQRRAELQGRRLTDVHAPQLCRAIMETTARYFDLNRAPEWDEREECERFAANLRRFEAVPYHRIARAAFVRYLVDRFLLKEEGLWRRINSGDDRATDVPDCPAGLTITMSLDIDGGGTIVNAAKGDGILAPRCAFLWDGELVGEVATMAEVRALQARCRGSE